MAKGKGYGNGHGHQQQGHQQQGHQQHGHQQHDHQQHGHHHNHHERSREYVWEEDMAAFFLKQARYDADRRYPPIAARVTRLAEGVAEPVILDLGCGPAMLLPELAKALPRARLVGMDPSGAMLELARRVLEEAGPGAYELKAGRAEDVPLEDASVDVVISLKNLHEWENAPKGMSELARVLRPGGTLLLRDANGGYPYWKLRLLVGWLRLTKGRIATHGYLGPYPDAYRPEQVEPLLAWADLRVLEAERRGVEFQFIAIRP